MILVSFRISVRAEMTSSDYFARLEDDEYIDHTLNLISMWVNGAAGSRVSLKQVV